QAAASHKLPFHSVRRPVKRAEAEAREARYRYLREVKQQTGCQAIITAQHQDDVIETVLMNVERGTGRYGLSPFMNTPDVVRPLVGVRKAELAGYARDNKLVWSEDPANQDMSYRRNVMRQEIVPALAKLHPEVQAELVAIAGEAAALNRRIDGGLKKLFKFEAGEAIAELARLRRLPFATLTEVLVAMARAVQPGAELDRLAVEQLALDCKTGRMSRPRQLTNRLWVRCSRARVITVFTP
ncbi:MAG TPA: tRNA lysidine(34) synthetase TilS, partial [Candidatus Polarisedimenticolaceae bacterium]|nr:tRNA lysidine(34) synthetase TilS [Candidatus Polarisedimenticolaceae bacterium]